MSEDKVIVRYDKSHVAKLTLLSDKMKMYYERLKNHILSYGVKNGSSWDGERFYKGRETLVKFVVRGKAIKVYYALTWHTVPEKFNAIDASDVKKYEKTPTMVKMKGPRSFAHAKELIDMLMSENEIDFVSEVEESYGDLLRTRSLQTLLDEELIKPVYGVLKEGAKEVSLIDEEFDDDDEEEEDFEEVAVTSGKNCVCGYARENVGRSLRAYVNLGVVNKAYKNGEVVNLESLKAKGLIRNDVLFVKLLADGDIDKKLTYNLNAYSKAAWAKIN